MMNAQLKAVREKQAKSYMQHLKKEESRLVEQLADNVEEQQQVSKALPGSKRKR